MNFFKQKKLMRRLRCKNCKKLIDWNKVHNCNNNKYIGITPIKRICKHCKGTGEEPHSHNKDYNDAVAFYLDARDNPEKHPDLGGEFNNNMNEPIGREFLCVDGEQYSEELALKWRDWLFNKIFVGGK